MPSTRPSKKQPDPPPRFFIDKSIGQVVVPAALREMGFEVFTLEDVYGMKKVPDPRWLRRSANEGWVCLTKDELGPWRSVICESRARVFRIARSANNAGLMIAYLQTTIRKIEHRSRQPGPFIYRVDERDLERVFPTQALPCP